MTEPIIVHQECFDVACTAVEGRQRFEHSCLNLFVNLAHYAAMKCANLNAGFPFPLRIEIRLDKDLMDYCLVAEVYSSRTESEQDE